jgi:chromosome segregation ATPase
MQRLTGRLFCFQALAGEMESVEKAMVKVATDIRGLEEGMLEALGEQTAAERSAGKTVQDTRELRRQIREEEVAITECQNEMAKLQVLSSLCSIHLSTC